MRYFIEVPDSGLSASQLFARLKKLARLYADTYGLSDRDFAAWGDGTVMDFKDSSAGDACRDCIHPELVAEALQLAHDLKNEFICNEDAK